MSPRLAILIAPLALLFGVNLAQAQHHGGGGHMGGAHMGGMHHGGMHMGGMHHGGYHGVGGYYGGIGYGGLGYGGFGYGFGYPYGGLGYYGLGYPGYGLGYGGIGYGIGYSRPLYRSYNYGPPSIPYSSGYYPSAPSVLGAAPLGSYSAPAASASSTPAAAVVNLTVPEGAKVWLNGKETATKKGQVAFTSPVMKPGEQATLNIKARWNDSTREMNLPITAGDKMSVDLRNQ